MEFQQSYTWCPAWMSSRNFKVTVLMNGQRINRSWAFLCCSWAEQCPVHGWKYVSDMATAAVLGTAGPQKPCGVGACLNPSALSSHQPRFLDHYHCTAATFVCGRRPSTGTAWPNGTALTPSVWPLLHSLLSAAASAPLSFSLHWHFPPTKALYDLPHLKALRLPPPVAQTYCTSYLSLDVAQSWALSLGTGLPPTGAPIHQFRAQLSLPVLREADKLLLLQNCPPSVCLSPTALSGLVRPCPLKALLCSVVLMKKAPLEQICFSFYLSVEQSNF